MTVLATKQLFPEDPFLASNRRISILVMAEAPPFPIDYKLKREKKRWVIYKSMI